MKFDASFAVLISFVTFMALVGRKVYAKVIVELDKKIDQIRESINISENEVRVAEQLNAEERRRQATIDEDIKVILEKTDRESARLKRKMIEEVEELTKVRQAAFEDMLARMRRQSMQKLRRDITESTTKSLEYLAQNKLSTKEHQAINDQAIELIAAELTAGADGARKAAAPSNKSGKGLS